MAGDSIKFVLQTTGGGISVEDQVVDKIVSDTEIFLKDPGA